MVKTHGNLLVKEHKLEPGGKKYVEIFAKILSHIDAASAETHVI